MINRKIAIITTALLALSVIYLTQCDIRDRGQGRTSSIEESKRKNVFICEYIPASNPFVVNDTIQFRIKEAWLEKRWNYTRNYFIISIYKEQYQLIVILYDINLDSLSYGIKWSIGRAIRNAKDIHELIGGYNYLFTMYFYSTPSDTETWKVYTGNFGKYPFPPDSVINEVGQFILYRKKE